MTRTRPISRLGEIRSRLAGRGGLLLALGLVLLSATPLAAAELPPASSVFSFRTNGPNTPIAEGDWYTANAGAGGGAGYHYVEITIPCGWPSGTPVHVDLLSPEMNQVSGTLGEVPTGNVDSTQFELYPPGTVVGFASPAPGTGIAGSRITFPPGAPGVDEQWVRYFTISPATCGTYVLRSEVVVADPGNPLGEGDDENAWRLRVGSDADADPNNALPANSDDADGVPGTNDEIVVGVAQATFQHDAGGTQCFTSYEHVAPGQPSVTFNNFDMDGNVRVRYYAPSDTYDPTGTSGGTGGLVSADTLWNGSASTARVGDTIPTPEPGWWRIVTCASDHDQFVQEGVLGRPAYLEQPPTPLLQVAKDDGLASVTPGQTVTYQIRVANAATGASAGAASQVVVADTLPIGMTFASCGTSIPAQGTWTCGEAAGVVTFTQSGWISAGSTATLEVTAQVASGAVGPLVNTVAVAYRDALGNPYPIVSASDTDAIGTSDLSIAKTDSPDPAQVGQSLTYTLTVRNDGPSDATAVNVTDTLPAGVTFGSATASQGSCSEASGTVTCGLGDLANGAQATVTIVVTPTAAGTLTNAASVSADQADPDPADDTDSEDTEVSAASADLTITKTADPSRGVEERDRVTYTIVVRNEGPGVADDVVVVEDPPDGMTLKDREASVGSFDRRSGSWTVGDLAAGAEERLELVFRVDEGTAGKELVNEVTAEAGTAVDPTPDDATDSARITVLAAQTEDPDDPQDPFDPVDPNADANPADVTLAAEATEATATTGAAPFRRLSLAAVLAVIGLALLVLPGRSERRRRLG